jgi:transcriptional regulator with XRE-family HTH domain
MHLSQFMAERELSDEDVAAAINRNRATVSRIRRGKVRPDWGTIIELRKFSAGQITASDFEEVP